MEAHHRRCLIRILFINSNHARTARAVVEAVDMDAFASALRGSFARGGRGGRGASTRFRSTRSDELAAFF